MSAIFLFLLVGIYGCSDEDDGRTCRPLGDFDATSGWEDPAYTPRTTEPGCYPFHASSTETFGEFISMRTSATDDADVSSCGEVFEALNCGTYSGEAGSLTFHAMSADRLTMSVSGTYRGRSVDTLLYFNPCQPGCLAAVSLLTLNEDQQKICEIPSQLAVCLFPEDAQTVSFARIGSDSLELRAPGTSHVFARE